MPGAVLVGREIPSVLREKITILLVSATLALDDRRRH